MADATVMRVDDMETFYGGMVTRVRAALGVASWGMQLFRFPPEFDAYSNHHQS